jgi:DNA-binding CsgD family transcriptional regulator
MAITQAGLDACPLTVRQLEICDLASEGLTTHSTALRMDLSYGIVQYERKRALDQLECFSTTHLVAKLLREGWLE